MKKIITLISMLMVFLVGNAQSQKIWEVASEKSVDEIFEGEGHNYILQQGFTDIAKDNLNMYLCSDTPKSAFSKVVTEKCIFHFIAVDELNVENQTFKVYVLQAADNGKYLTDKDPSFYTRSIAKAFRFTIRKGTHHGDIPNFDMHKVSWIQFSNHLFNAPNEEMGAWVFCYPNPEEPTTSKRFVGAVPSENRVNLDGTFRTNPWIVLEAKSHDATAIELLNLTLETIFGNKDINNAGDFPTGEGVVGAGDKVLFNEMYSKFNEASTIVQDPSFFTEEEILTVRKELIECVEKFNASLNTLTPGYYQLFQNQQRNVAYEKGNNIYVEDKTENVEYPSGAVTPDRIWRIYQSDANHYYIQNWYSGRFLGRTKRSNPWPLIADSTERVTITVKNGSWHLIKDATGNTLFRMTQAGRTTVLAWGSETEANQWRLIKVPADTIQKYQEVANTHQLIYKMAALIESGKSLMLLQSNSGLTYDGNYGPRAKGLVTTAIANSHDVEGNVEKFAFDGNTNTYYHSNFERDEQKNPDLGHHWMQMDLGKKVSSIVLKFSDRGNRPNHNLPKEIAFVAPKADEAVETGAEWTDTLCKVVAQTTYPTKYGNTVMDSTTYIGENINFGKEVQNVRFVVLQTIMNDRRPLTGTAVTWNLSELRIYDQKDCIENPLFTMVPEEIKAALNNAIVKAAEEVETQTCQQATYDELEAAIKAFQDNYPDPSEFNEKLEQANYIKDHIKTVPEDADPNVQQIGYFQKGAVEEYAAAITALTAEVENKALTIEELNANLKKLEEINKALYAKLIVPEDGKIYRIQSQAGLDDENNEKEAHGTFLVASNADSTHNVMWKYKENVDPSTADRFNALWYMQKTDKGYSFKNLANGLYMNNVYDGLTKEEAAKVSNNDRRIGYSSTPKYFNFEPAFTDGTIKITLGNGWYFNCQPNSGNIVRYNNPLDANEQLKFIECTSEEFSQTFAVDVIPGAYQIITLPFEVVGAYNMNFEPAMKVLGIKDNKIRLAPYTENENIPAGTPFIIKTSEPTGEEGAETENAISVDLIQADPEECFNMEYNYNTVVDNGLVSAPRAITLENGVGYIYDNMVFVSEGIDKVKAGSGFFDKTLPQTTEDGVDFIEMTDPITGVGAGVGQLTIVKNTNTNVYTISGLLVRKNVKMSNATKGLPQGIYIVGNKKVFVK